MNDSIKQALVSAAEWTHGQIPSVIHQLIVWTIVENLMTIVFAVLLVFAFYRAMKALNAQMAEENVDSITDMRNGFLWFAGLSALFLAMVGTILGSVVAVYTVSELLIAPKVWLLEYTVQQLHK